MDGGVERVATLMDTMPSEAIKCQGGSTQLTRGTDLVAGPGSAHMVIRNLKKGSGVRSLETKQSQELRLSPS